MMAAASRQPGLAKHVSVAGLLAPVLSLRRVNTPLYRALRVLPADVWLGNAGVYGIGQVGEVGGASDPGWCCFWKRVLSRRGSERDTSQRPAVS